MDRCIINLKLSTFVFLCKVLRLSFSKYDKHCLPREECTINYVNVDAWDSFEYCYLSQRTPCFSRATQQTVERVCIKVVHQTTRSHSTLGYAAVYQRNVRFMFLEGRAMNDMQTCDSLMRIKSSDNSVNVVY